MTAIKDALKKAGIDTAAAELQSSAAQAIRNHGGSAADAAPKFIELMLKRNDLLNALARDYLMRIAGEMRVMGEPLTLPERPRDVKVHALTVPKHRRRDHVRHRRRTKDEKAAATRVAAQQSAVVRSVYDRRIIDGRLLGELSWGEAGTLEQAQAADAASYITLGITAIENAIILRKIRNHASVDDHRTKIRDVISEDQLEQFEQEARALAPLVSAMAQHRTRDVVLHHDTLLVASP